MKKNKISKVNDLLEKEALKSESLLRNILPEKIIQDLKENHNFITEQYEECTVMFTDFKDFVKVTELLPPNEIVDELNYCFGYFDEVGTPLSPRLENSASYVSVFVFNLTDNLSITV